LNRFWRSPTFPVPSSLYPAFRDDLITRNDLLDAQPQPRPSYHLAFPPGQLFHLVVRGFVPMAWCSSPQWQTNPYGSSFSPSSGLVCEDPSPNPLSPFRVLRILSCCSPPFIASKARRPPWCFHADDFRPLFQLFQFDFLFSFPSPRFPGSFSPLSLSSPLAPVFFYRLTLYPGFCNPLSSWSPPKSKMPAFCLLNFAPPQNSLFGVT